MEFGEPVQVTEENFGYARYLPVFNRRPIVGKFPRERSASGRIAVRIRAPCEDERSTASRSSADGIF